MNTVRTLLIGALLALLYSITASHLLAQGRVQASTFAEIAILEDERAIDTLKVAAWVQSADPDVRARVAYMIGIVGDETYRPFLMKLLDDDVRAVRVQSIFAAGQLTDTLLTPYLLRYSADGDSSIKSHAIEALSKLGNESAAKQLMAILADSLEKPCFRALAAESIHRLRDRVSFGSLVAHSRNPHDSIREKVFFSLARRASAQALPFYLEGLKDSNNQVRIYSLIALSRVGDKSVLPEVRRSLNEDDWRAKFYCLGTFDRLKATEYLSQILSLLDAKQHVYVRQAAIRVLGDLGDSTVQRYLLPLLKDKDANLANEALTAIAKLVKGEATARILEFASSSDRLRRQGAATACEQLKSINSWDIPAKLAADPVPFVRTAAFETLLQWDSSEVRNKFLLQALNDTDLVPVTLASDQIAAGRMTQYLDTLCDRFVSASTAGNTDIKVAILSAFIGFGDSLARSERLDKIVQSSLTDENRSVRLLTERVAEILKLPFTPGDRRFTTSITPETYPALYVTGRANPIAEISTVKGKIRIELLRGIAPKTVANFIKLAENGFYNNRVWHRVVPDFVIQDGCPRGDGWGGPGYEIRCEYSDLPYNTGSVGLATSGKDTGGSQYFICQSPQPHLNGRYTQFGKVIEGMDVVERIEIGDAIKSVKIIESKE